MDEMHAELREGAALFSACWNASIDRIAIENPIMHGHAKALIVNYRPPAQWCQPWQHGHPETKRLGLWLKNLTPLEPTNIVDGREARVHRMSGTLPAEVRRRERSRFYPGVAAAMAVQWGDAARLAEAA